MADARKLAIQGAVTTTVGLLDAGTFADALLRQERLLMPGGQTNASITEQASKLKANTPYLQKIAAAWEKKPDVIDSFGRTLNANPAYLKKFQEISAKDARDGRMDVSTALFERYAAGGSRELAKAIDVQHRNMYPDQHRPAPAKTAERPPAPAKPREDKPEPRETVRAKPAEAVAATAAPKTAPVNTVAAPVSGDQTAPAPTATASGPVTTDSAVPIIQTAVLQYGEIFGDEFVPQQEALIKRLETDKPLAQRLTNIINSDPDLKKQLEQADGSNQGGLIETFKNLPPEKQADVRNAIRPYYRQILDDPEKIGSKPFRDEMQNAAVDVATPGWLKGLKDMFGGMDLGNFDLAGLLQPIAALFQKAVAAFQETFGDGKFMNMVSSVGDKVRDLSGDLLGPNTGNRQNVYIDKDKGQEIDPNVTKPKPDEPQRQLAQNPINPGGAPQPAGGNLTPPASLGAS